MGEKKPETKTKRNKTKEKILRLVIFSPTLLRYGGRLFSCVRERRKQAVPTLSGRGYNLMGQKNKGGLVRTGCMNVWVRCEPSTPWCKSQNGRTRSQACWDASSKPLPQRAQSGISARPALKFKPRSGKAFRTSHQLSENTELFKKPEPGVRFQWERTSSAVQPCRSLRGSEEEPTTNYRYSSFRGSERSMDPESLRRAERHSWANCVSAYVDLRLLGLTWGEEKSYSPFDSTPRPLTRISLSMRVFQRASGSPDQAYPYHHCAYV